MELKESKKILGTFKLANAVSIITQEEFEDVKSAIETVLQALNNSIPKEKVEKKIEYLKHQDFIKLQVCYKHDNEALSHIQVLQELLEE